jgi:hypothetical protein
MSTHTPKSRRWIAAVVIALTIVGVGLSIAARTRPARQQEFLCWDTPSSGTPAKYLVTFDGGTSLDTTAECVRVPAELLLGDHVGVVRAVDAYGQMSPPASLTFTIR